MKSAIVVPSLIRKSRPPPLDKGKSRIPPSNITTSRGISSSDYFATAVSPPPEYDSISPRRRPSSINYTSFAGGMSASSGAGGGPGSGSGSTPTRMHSRAWSSASIVRAVSTNPMRVGMRGSTSTIRGPPRMDDRSRRESVRTSEAEDEIEEEIVQEEIVGEEVERTLGPIGAGGVGLVRSISSTSSTTGSEWATDQGSPVFTRPANNRRETPSDSQNSSPLIPSSSSFSPPLRTSESIFANFDGFNTVSPSLSLSEFPEGPIGEERENRAHLPLQKFAREASVPKLTMEALSPALELAQIITETGSNGIEEVTGEVGVGETSWEMVPDERSSSPVSVLSAGPSFGRLEPRAATTRRASYRDPEDEQDTTTPSGERQFSFAQAIRDGPPISPPPLHTSNSSRSSLTSNPPPSPRTGSKRWSINASLFNRGNFIPPEVSPTTIVAPPPPPAPTASGMAASSSSAAAGRESREEVRARSSDVKRKPIPAVVEPPVTLPPSTTLMHDEHASNLVSPLLLAFRFDTNF